MSLRVRLFLLLGALVAGLVLAEWLLVRSLSRDLAREVDEVALRVGESLVTTVALAGASWSADVPGPERRDTPASPAAAPPGLSTHHQRVELRGTLRPPEIEGFPPGRTGVERAHGLLVRPLDGLGSTLDDLTPEETFLLLAALDELEARHGNASVPNLAVVDRDGRELEGADLERALAEGEATLVLSVDSPLNSSFLRLSGPSVDERIPIPREGIEDALSRFGTRLLLGSGVLLLVGLAGAAVIAQRTTAPLRRLGAAARDVGDGALGTQVEETGAGEIAQTLAAFNAMSARLEQLDAAAKRLREREHLGEIGEVARGLAHGLRNPLNALGLSLEELSEPSLDEERRRALAESARRQIRRVDEAVRSFLALATSADAGRSEPVDLVGLVEDVVLEVLQDARGRVAVRAETDGEEHVVEGVPAELHALVQALVANAVDASPEGAVVVARVGGTPDGGVRVEVDDSGPGIPREVRSRLFTPHVTTKANGAGIGLFLAHRIATARHGGRLSLNDREEGGTRAVLELPATTEVRDG